MNHSGSHAKPALTERDIGTLQALLDGVPAPLEPLDVSVLDGFFVPLSLHPVGYPPRSGGIS